jgi:alkaline phosphatase D
MQGITVYYSAFSYGGVSFAVLEDRKFKNINEFGRDRAGDPLPLPRELLGPRQESFLRAWAGMHAGQPKVCLHQSPFACIQTDPNGNRRSDPDSNGAPRHGRRTAVTLLRDARAILLAGDQHIGTLIRHGIDTFTDGPIEFTPPSAGTAWQRWFEPAANLSHPRGPNTGDYTDGFGNKFRVLAVANSKVSYAEVERRQRNNSDVCDRRLKREGYGIVHVDKEARRYELECWPWHTNPRTPGAAQYPGWPVSVAFSHV